MRTSGYGDDLLTLRSLKAFADGSVGASTKARVDVTVLGGRIVFERAGTPGMTAR